MSDERKVLNWDKTYKTPLRGSRGKYGSYKEMLQSVHSKEETAKKERAAFTQLEPHLRKGLLDHMLNRTPFTVLAPIHYIAEFLGKSGGFDTGTKVIPTGTELTYLHHDKTLGQWIFKGQDGAEYEIYTDPVVLVPDRFGPRQMMNSGFYGLLTATSIYQEVVESLAESEEKE